MFNFNPQINPYSSKRNLHYAYKGMVATSQPLAAQAGLQIMQKGGNAIDAAIATAACLTVVEPTSNGIGSDAFAIVWIDEKMYGLNASGKSPKSISIEKVRALGFEEMPKLGMIPITVPGAPGAWSALSERFGKLPLAECLAPAIDYARNGFAVSPTVAKFWNIASVVYSNNAKGNEFKSWFDTFNINDNAPSTGDLVTLKDHANTLEEIGATNAKSFYRGDLAKKISSFIKKHGGFLTEDDLSNFKPEWVDPISINYKGYDIWELPPNGQGLIALIALNFANSINVSDKDNAELYHMQFEVIKYAFATGKKYITDPNFSNINYKEFLTKKYADKFYGEIDLSRVHDPKIIPPNKSGTVYLATADGDGNMVSFIQSNYMGFGSGIVIPNTGIAMQNRGADFSLDKNHVNALSGSKKTYHTIIPGFMTTKGKAIGPFGIMGGYMQPQAHFQVIMNMISFGMNPQAALDAPRWQWINGKYFDIENHFPKHIAEELINKGHIIKMQIDSSSFGRGQIILRDPKTGVLIGGTESRCDGTIASW